MSISRVVVAGLIASIVMGMVEMLYEAIGGAGFWSPVVFIGATVLRDLQSVSVPVPFMAIPVVLGLMGHMMNSVVLGLVFRAIFSGLRASREALIGVGVVYALVVFAVMWYLVVPAIDPVMLKLNGTVFAIAHMMWGAVLGLVISTSSEAVGRLKTAT